MHALFNNISDKDKDLAIEDLIHDSTPRPSFFFLVILSVLMATFGLLINNASVVIGSMLIAPILSPVLSLALGVVMADSMIISRSFYTLLKSVLFGVGLAALATWIFGATADFNNPEIASRVEPSVTYLAIAVVAGLATAYARVKPDLNETLPGTAIAVALVPPLAVTGIGIATFNWAVTTGSLLLFVLNAIGIIFASMFMFSLMNLYNKRAVANETAKEEDAALKEESK